MTTVSALWLKHRPLARMIARDYFLPGSDRQDVEQEAMVALWEAATDYRADGGASFPTFARLVINRRLGDCVRDATRRKHQPLTLALREAVTEDGDLVEIIQLLPCLHQVADVAEDREEIRRILRVIATELSDLERHAVIGIAAGLSYPEIGTPAVVDNALQRARVKLRAAA